MDNPSADENKVVEFIYRNYGKYYTDIVRSMSDKIFDWVFALNTGALTATITFMAVAIKWKDFAFDEVLPFLMPLVIFFLGICSITAAAFLEHRRFETKGKQLDEVYSKRKLNQEFLDKIPPKTECYDLIVPFFERASYFLFCIGFIISIIGLLFHAK